MILRLRPIESWPREQTRYRKDSPFIGRDYNDRRREVPYSTTMRDLDRELRHLKVKEGVLQLAVREADIRLDGELRADARPAHPGVILTFTAPKVGVLTYACDLFTKWQTNLRAITKGLEALRLLDRYGITSSGEQYIGWKELPGGDDARVPVTDEPMSLEMAARIVVGWISGEHDLAKNARIAVEDPDYRRYAYRQALMGLHPDTGTDVESTDGFIRLQRAYKLLDENDDA